MPNRFNVNDFIFQRLARLPFVGSVTRARDLVRLLLFYGAGQLVWLIVIYDLLWFSEFGASAQYEVAVAWGLWAAYVTLFTIIAFVQGASYLGIYHYPFINLYRHWFVSPSVIILYVIATVLAAYVNSADVQAQHMLLPLVTLAPLAQIFPLPIGFVLALMGTVTVAVFYPDLEPISAAYYLLQQLVLIVMTRAFANEKVMMDSLMRRNDELGATQSLLSEASRQNERLRIARNIHDLVGHHVTALSLNLEALSLRTDGEVKEDILAVHKIAKELLTKVRAAVSEYRMDVALPVADILSELTSHAPGLNIELDLEEGLVVRDAAVVETILRTAQEVVTNTLKHAGANNLFIQLHSKDGQLFFLSIDDGRGCKKIREGNGLKGMLERVQSLGGSCRFESEQGFKVQITLPLSGGSL